MFSLNLKIRDQVLIEKGALNGRANQKEGDCGRKVYFILRKQIINCFPSFLVKNVSRKDVAGIKQTFTTGMYNKYKDIPFILQSFLK